MVRQKLDSKLASVELINQDVQPNKNAEEVVVNTTSDEESNVENENDKLPLPMDDVDRVNIKRHIIDINQDIADFETISDDSHLYKRDVEVEVKEEEPKEEVKEEEVDTAAPAAAVVPVALLPKVREAIKKLRDQIPSSAEIKTAWEGVRKDLNEKVNLAIVDAKKRAADLRDKLTPSPPPPAPPAPVKFNPFLKSENVENKENDVGMALAPIVPAPLPIVPAPLPVAPIKVPVAPVIAPVPALAPLAIQADIVKTIAQFRANNKVIQDAAMVDTKVIINNLGKNLRLLTPPLFVGGVHEEGEEVEEKKDEEEKKEE